MECAGANEGQKSESGADNLSPGFKLFLRDLNQELVDAWREKDAFGDDRFKGLVEASWLRQAG